jgi:hypothetical protein
LYAHMNNKRKKKTESMEEVTQTMYVHVNKWIKKEVSIAKLPFKSESKKRMFPDKDSWFLENQLTLNVKVNP